MSRWARLRSPLLLDFVSLYGLQFSNFLIPVLTLPVLSRVLAPAEWASLLVAQAAGLAVTTLVEYGHNITATRQVATAAGPPELGWVVGVTLGSKALLAALALLVTLGVWLSGAHLASLSTPLLWAGLLFGLLQGSLPIWYFQGQERARVAASLDMGVKLVFAFLMLGAVWLWRTPEAALWTQVLGLALSWTLLNRRMASELRAAGVAVRAARWPEVLNDLRRAFQVFVFRFMGTSYTSALALVLALVARPAEVALILAADRIAKVLPVMSVPFCQALYPRISRSGAALTAQGLAVVGRYLLLGAGIFLAGSAGLFLLRGLVVPLLLGTEYAAAGDILRYSLWLMPLIALNTVLLQLWAFPAGRDRLANLVLLTNATLTLTWVFAAYGRVDLPLYAAGISLGEAAAFVVLLVAFVTERRRLRTQPPGWAP